MNATPAFPNLDTPLLNIIQERLSSGDVISFRDYMELALYHPEHGYYTSPTPRVGKQGDFITSVSVGPCFGMILARRLHAFWKSSGCSSTFHIVEPGAHDGALCSDILSEIARLDTSFYQAVHYHLIEKSEHLRNRQWKKLNKSFLDKFSSHAHLNDIRSPQTDTQTDKEKKNTPPHQHLMHGAILSNELIDAFPVELLQFHNQEWCQMMVSLDKKESLTLRPQPLTPAKHPEMFAFFNSLAEKLNQVFPEGYLTEYNPSIDDFTRDVSHVLDSGIFITIDYGHATEDYYHPSRTEGTLQTYYQQQKSDNPLVTPGEIDMTAHVDFTRLTTCAEAHGFTNPSLRTQASYLTDHARTWLLDIENPDTETPRETPQLLRQFQSLIHPAMLGTKFSVLEMELPLKRKKHI